MRDKNDKKVKKAYVLPCEERQGVDNTDNTRGTILTSLRRASFSRDRYK